MKVIKTSFHFNCLLINTRLYAAARREGAQYRRRLVHKIRRCLISRKMTILLTRSYSYYEHQLKKKKKRNVWISIAKVALRVKFSLKFRSTSVRMSVLKQITLALPVLPSNRIKFLIRNFIFSSLKTRVIYFIFNFRFELTRI